MVSFPSLGSAASGAAGAVNDLFSAEGHRYKAQGNRLEAENYDRAGALARKNEEYTQWTTDVKQQFSDRQMYSSLGRVTAAVAGSGLKTSGSALDLLHESEMNGHFNTGMLGAQGQIQVEAYDEQAKSFDTMAKSARVAAEAEDSAATGAEITGAIKGVGAVFSAAAAFL